MKNMIKLATLAIATMFGIALKADSVSPKYCSHNDIVGDTQIMTNTFDWVTNNFAMATNDFATKEYVDAHTPGDYQTISGLAMTAVQPNAISDMGTKYWVTNLLVGNEFDLNSSSGIKEFCEVIIHKLGGTVKVPNYISVSLKSVNADDIVSIGRTYSTSPITVDWGDGTSYSSEDNVARDGGIDIPNHKYAVGGNYTILIDGNIVHIDGFSTSYTNGEYVVRTNNLGEGVVDAYDFTKITNNITFGDLLFFKSNIKEIHIPYNVTNLGIKCFSGCTNLEKVVFDKNSRIEKISDYCFTTCKKLNEIVLPTNNLTKIGKYAFANCTKLEYISLPETIKEFDTDCMLNAGFTNADIYCSPKKGPVFSYNLNLKNITLHHSCTSICNAAFKNCGIESLYIPNSIISIDDDAFTTLTSLKSVSFEENSNLKKLGMNFAGSQYFLKELSLPEGLEYFGGIGANCAVINIIFPSSLKKLGALQFADKASRTTFDLHVSPSIESTEQTFYNWNKMGDITIPKSMKTIGAKTFMLCSELTNVVYEYGCPNLVCIGDSCFKSCTALTNFECAVNVETIDSEAFSKCTKLEKITIGENVNKIGIYVCDGDTSLKTIVCNAIVPPTRLYNQYSILGTIPSSCKILVPASSVDTYKNAPGWSGYSSNIFAQE